MNQLSSKYTIDKTYSEAVKNLADVPNMQELFKLYYKTGQEFILKRIVEGLQKMIIDVCNKNKDKLENCNIDYMDLIQEANKCVINVIKNKFYNPDKKINPSTYFYRVLDSAINDALTNNSSSFNMTAYIKNILKRVRKFNEDIEKGMDRKKALKKNKVTEKMLKDYPDRKSVSIYTPLEHDFEDSDATKLLDIIPDTIDTEKEIVSNNFKDMLKKYLTNQEYEIFIKVYDEGYSADDISEIMGIDRNETYKILNNSRKKLQKNREIIEYYKSNYRVSEE